MAPLFARAMLNTGAGATHEILKINKILSTQSKSTQETGTEAESRQETGAGTKNRLGRPVVYG